MEENSSKVERRLYTVEIQNEISALRVAVTALTVQSSALESLVQEHSGVLKELDKIVVRGNGVPSLQETVRTLNKTMTDFIVEVRSERERREKDEWEERHRKEKEMNKWKWALIGVGIPLLLAFAGQFIVFWIRIVPALQVVTTTP